MCFLRTHAFSCSWFHFLILKHVFAREFLTGLRNTRDHLPTQWTAQEGLRCQVSPDFFSEDSREFSNRTFFSKLRVFSKRFFCRNRFNFTGELRPGTSPQIWSGSAAKSSDSMEVFIFTSYMPMSCLRNAYARYSYLMYLMHLVHLLRSNTEGISNYQVFDCQPAFVERVAAVFGIS